MRQAQGTGYTEDQEGKQTPKKGTIPASRKAAGSRGGVGRQSNRYPGVNQAIGIVGLRGVTCCIDNSHQLLQVFMC